MVNDEDMGQIEDVCEAYYKGIYATDVLPELDFTMFDKLEPRHVLNNAMADDMVAKVTRAKIYGVLTAT